MRTQGFQVQCFIGGLMTRQLMPSQDAVQGLAQGESISRSFNKHSLYHTLLKKLFSGKGSLDYKIVLHTKNGYFKNCLLNFFGEPKMILLQRTQ